MKIEFIKPKLVGERFDDHTIPVEVLKDWAAFEGLLVETAKWVYLEKNPGRQRVPRGFADGFALHLSGIGAGSAVAILERTCPQGGLFPDVYAEWFEQARDRIVEVIAAASAGQAVDTLLPKHLLSYFDKFGRSLRDAEKVEFSNGNGSAVIYDARTRKTLVLRTASEYRTEEQLRGAISELDAERETLTFKLVSGRKISGTYAKEVREQAVEALANFGESLVLVECVVVRDQSDTPKAIENINRIDPLDPLDVPARLEALSLLSDGWLDGAGIAPSKQGLSWLGGAWLAHWPKESPLPHIYPTPEGKLQAEWSLKGFSLSLEIDLIARQALLLVARSDTGDVEREQTLNLDTAEGWMALSDAVVECGPVTSNL